MVAQVLGKEGEEEKKNKTERETTGRVASRDCVNGTTDFINFSGTNDKVKSVKKAGADEG
jgi:hypothetical protein